MNKTEFIQTGGFRLRLERLAEMQTAYSVFNALGYIAGDKAILSGCVATGSTTSNGFVFVNGEVLPFNGGPTLSTVKIVEQNVNAEFQDGSIKTVHKIRTVTFATGSDTMPWADFKRGIATTAIEGLLEQKATTEALTTLANRVATLEKYAAPFAVSGGGMVLWRKPANEIPNGWREVADWRGRLPMGWNPDDEAFSTMGQNIGAKTANVSVTLPYSGWEFTSTEKPAVNKGGRLVVASGDNEQTEYLESIAVAKANKSGTGSINLLNPARIVMFIEPIPA